MKKHLRAAGCTSDHDERPFARSGRRVAAIRTGVSLVACVAAMTTMPALAQQTAPVRPDAAPESTGSVTAPDGDIVVTASKTGAERLMRVPQAIQAFSGATLKERNIRDGADLIELIPGASQAQEIGAGYRIYSFRGSGAGGPIGDGLVGYYLDDTPFGVPNNQSAPPINYFDIDRVDGTDSAEMTRDLSEGNGWGHRVVASACRSRTRAPTLLLSGGNAAGANGAA